MTEMLTRPVMGMPLWVWVIVVAGGVILAIYIRRNVGSSSASGSLGQNAAGQQSVTDPNIDPYTGVPYSIEEAINPATGLPAYYGGPGVDATGSGSGPSSSGSGSSSGGGVLPIGPTRPRSQQTLLVRAQNALAGAGSWDQTHAGPPVDPNAPGNTNGQFVVPFGASVTQTGPAVQGPANKLASGQSSAMWYPIAYQGQTGYISALDVQTGGAAAAGGASGPQVPFQATPWWPEMTDLAQTGGH